MWCFVTVSLDADVPPVSRYVSLPALTGRGSCQQKSLRTSCFSFAENLMKCGGCWTAMYESIAIDNNVDWEALGHEVTKSVECSTVSSKSRPAWGFSCCTATFWVLNLLRWPETFTKHKLTYVIFSTTWSGDPALYHMASWTLILGPKYVNPKGPCKMEISEFREVQKCHTPGIAACS